MGDLAVHDHQELAPQFAPVNLEPALVLVNVQVLFPAVAPSHHVMVAPLVLAAAPMPGEEVDQVAAVLVAEQVDPPVVHQDPVAQVVALAVQQVLAAPLVVAVKLAVKLIANRNHERLVAKRSITYVHQLSVAQLFHVAMAQR